MRVSDGGQIRTERLQKAEVDARASGCSRPRRLALPGLREPGRLEVHHVKPLADTTKDDDPYKTTGLITLCRPCHFKQHRLEKIADASAANGNDSWRNAMGFDYVWQLKPNTAGQPDDVTRDVWVDLNRSDSTVVPYQISVDGGTAPVASRTVRIRWIAGVSTRSTLRDPEGNTWAVRDYQEVGRRKWIDLSVQAIDLQTGPDDVETVPSSDAPAGWQLRDENGNAVVMIPAAIMADEYTSDLPPVSAGYPGWALVDSRRLDVRRRLGSRAAIHHRDCRCGVTSQVSTRHRFFSWNDVSGFDFGRRRRSQRPRNLVERIGLV